MPADPDGRRGREAHRGHREGARRAPGRAAARSQSPKRDLQPDDRAAVRLVLDVGGARPAERARRIVGGELAPAAERQLGERGAQLGARRRRAARRSAPGRARSTLGMREVGGGAARGGQRAGAPVDVTPLARLAEVGVGAARRGERRASRPAATPPQRERTRRPRRAYSHSIVAGGFDEMS